MGERDNKNYVRGEGRGDLSLGWKTLGHPTFYTKCWHDIFFIVMDTEFLLGGRNNMIFGVEGGGGLGALGYLP